jgi:hypothetical membrane protein
MALIALAATIAATVWLVVAMWLLARRKPGYRHLEHTISELGEVGSPDQRLVALGVFLPVGVLLLVAAAAMISTVPAAAALAAAIAAGYLGAAVLPCDAGAPAAGTIRNMGHMLFGAVEYIGGGFALMVLSESLGQPFKAAGFVVLASALLIGYLPSSLLRGGIQRVSEAVLFGSLILAIVRGAAIT